MRLLALCGSFDDIKNGRSCSIKEGPCSKA